MRKLVYTALTAALLVSACHSRLEFKEFDRMRVQIEADEEVSKMLGEMQLQLDRNARIKIRLILY